jgi:choline dehydrogenase-like flavoprotein
MQQANTTEEVVSSAGAIRTLQLLMLSGIGNAKELAASNIPAIVHLPGVGKNFSVQVSTSIKYTVNSTDTIDDAIRNATVRNELLTIWNKMHGSQIRRSSTSNTCAWRTIHGFGRWRSFFWTQLKPLSRPSAGNQTFAFHALRQQD